MRIALLLLATGAAWIAPAETLRSGAVFAAGQIQSSAFFARQEVSAQQKRPVRKPAGEARRTQPDPRARIPFTAAEQDVALIPDIADARVWSDNEQEFLKTLPAEKGTLARPIERRRRWRVRRGAPQRLDRERQAAGIFRGHRGLDRRADGALRLCGSRYDGALRQAYTGINAGDIFEAGGKGESFLDTWPLKELDRQAGDARPARRHRGRAQARPSPVSC